MKNAVFFVPNFDCFLSKKFGMFFVENSNVKIERFSCKKNLSFQKKVKNHYKKVPLFFDFFRRSTFDRPKTCVFFARFTCIFLLN